MAAMLLHNYILPIPVVLDITGYGHMSVAMISMHVEQLVLCHKRHSALHTAVSMRYYLLLDTVQQVL